MSKGGNNSDEPFHARRRLLFGYMSLFPKEADFLSFVADIANATNAPEELKSEAVNAYRETKTTTILDTTDESESGDEINTNPNPCLKPPKTAFTVLQDGAKKIAETVATAKAKKKKYKKGGGGDRKSVHFKRNSSSDTDYAGDSNNDAAEREEDVQNGKAVDDRAQKLAIEALEPYAESTPNGTIETLVDDGSNEEDNFGDQQHEHDNSPKKAQESSAIAPRKRKKSVVLFRIPDEQSLAPPAQRTEAAAVTVTNSTSNGLARYWLKLPLLLLWWPYRVVLIMLAGIFIAANYVVDTETCSSTQFGDLLFGPDNLLLLRKNVRETFVCGQFLRGVELGTTERLVMFALSLVGVFGDIIPKYLTGGMAKRHVNQRKANRFLLIHIVSGTISVIGGGIGGMLGGFDAHEGLLFWGFCASDFVHQLSICVLCKNHDGIWPLRLGNFVLLVAKFVTLVNHNYFPGTQLPDIIFTVTFGALGTRLASVMAYVSQSLLKRERQLKLEIWYSLGLTIALFYIIWRIPNSELYMFGNVTLVSYLYYHEIWPRKMKSKFVAFNAVLSIVCMGFIKSASVRTVILFFYFIGAGYMQPRFYRCPEKALTADKQTEKEKQKNADAFRRQMLNRLNSHMTSMRLSSHSLKSNLTNGRGRNV